MPSDGAIEAEVSVLLREFAECHDTDGAWVSRRTAAEVCKERMHVYGQDKQRLLGATFTEEGKEFCIEEFGPRSAGDSTVGIWAFDVEKHASATLRLRQRCTFSGSDVLNRLWATIVAADKSAAAAL